MSSEEQQTNFTEFCNKYITDVTQAVWRLDDKRIEDAVKIIEEVRSADGMVWLVGNGGSAALASHMATDLQLASVKAIALTDVAAVTTYANDVDFSQCFAHQLAKLVKPEDVVILISGSGSSPNIVAAYMVASTKCKTIAITGFDGGRLGDALKPTVHINVPAKHMGVSQDGHQVVLHIITYWLMAQRNHGMV